jgi:hypothetical protein
MRHTAAALLTLAAVVPALSQGKKEPPLHQRVAREGVRAGDVFILASGKEGTQERGDIPLSVLDVTLYLVAAVDDRRIGFISWNKEGSVSLIDDLGNIYFHVRNRAENVAATVLYSDRHATARLLFERPVPKAQRLSLELSGENISSRDRFKLSLRRGKSAGEWVLVKEPEPKKAKP